MLLKNLQESQRKKEGLCLLEAAAIYRMPKTKGSQTTWRYGIDLESLQSWRKYASEHNDFLNNSYLYVWGLSKFEFDSAGRSSKIFKFFQNLLGVIYIKGKPAIAYISHFLVNIVVEIGRKAAELFITEHIVIFVSLVSFDMKAQSSINTFHCLPLYRWGFRVIEWKVSRHVLSKNIFLFVRVSDSR